MNVNNIVNEDWRRRGVLWVSCLFTVSVVSIDSSVVSSMANLLLVVTWLAGGLVWLLLAFILNASSLRFFECGSFAKRDVLSLCHGGARVALL